MKLILTGIALVLAMPALAETLTNDSVVQLTKLGLGDVAIIAKIKASDQSFDVSTTQMIALKGQGVSGPVIAAMLDATAPKAAAMSLDGADPMLPHPTGVYLLTDGHMVKIDPTATNQAKTGGIIGYALTAGIASMSVKASIQNESARTKALPGKPEFYFFFDESNPGTNRQGAAFASGDAASVSSPSEFTLIELDKKNGRREARVGSVNIGGAKSGVMDSDRVAFDYQPVRPGVYRVTPITALKPGEYGFIYAIQGGATRGATTARIFDFSIPKS